LSGALGPMVPVSAETVVTAEFTGLGNVSATFGRGAREAQP
jgi:2-keto-4-pentenoate hydratase